MKTFRTKLTGSLRSLLTSSGKMLGSTQKLLDISLPMRVSVFVAVFLIACTLFFVVRAELNDDIEQLSIGRLGMIVILSAIIACIAYLLTREWIVKTRKPDEDLTRDWNVGWRALKRAEIDFRKTPIYLVIGVDSVATARQLLAATKIRFDVSATPDNEDASLQWFANRDAIYLVVVQAGVLCKLHQNSNAIDERVLYGITPSPDEDLWLSAGYEKSPLDISANDLNREKERFGYLMDLLRSHRQPVVASNGVIAVLPHRALAILEPTSDDISVAVAADKAAITDWLKVRCPLTFLIVDRAAQGGIRALAEAAQTVSKADDSARILESRVGTKGGIWGKNNPDRLDRIATAACENVQEKIQGSLFSPNNLDAKLNRDLAWLAIKYRLAGEKNLKRTLQAIAPPLNQSDASEPLLSGVYFASIPPSGSPAFIRSLLADKVQAEHDQLKWSEKAETEDRRFSHLAKLLWFANIVGCLIAIGLYLIAPD